LFHDGGRPAQRAWRQKIIRKEQEKVIGTRPVDPRIEGGVGTKVFRAQQQLDTSIRGRKALCHVGAVVRRSVVDDQDTDLGHILRQHAVHAGFEIAAVIVVGDDDVDACHGSCSRCDEKPSQTACAVSACIQQDVEFGEKWMARGEKPDQPAPAGKKDRCK